MENKALKNALVKVAARNSLRTAFADELMNIDPEFEKIAWARAIRGIKRGYRATVRGAKRVGNWAYNNPVEAGLTALSFVPVIGPAAAIGRGAAMLYRGGRMAMGARKAFGARKALAMTRAAAPGATREIGKQMAAKMPWNRSLGGISRKMSPFANLSRAGKVGRIGMTGAGGAMVYSGAKHVNSASKAYQQQQQAQQGYGAARGGSYLNVLKGS